MPTTKKPKSVTDKKSIKNRSDTAIVRASNSTLKNIAQSSYKQSLQTMDSWIDSLNDVIISTNSNSAILPSKGKEKSSLTIKIMTAGMQTITKLPEKRAKVFTTKIIKLLENITQNKNRVEQKNNHTILAIYNNLDTLNTNLGASLGALQNPKLNIRQLSTYIAEITDSIQPLTITLKSNIDAFNDSAYKQDFSSIQNTTDALNHLIQAINVSPSKRSTDLAEPLFTATNYWIKHISARKEQRKSIREVISALETVNDCLKNISHKIRENNTPENAKNFSILSTNFYALKLLIIRFNNYIYNLKKYCNEENDDDIFSKLSNTLNLMINITLKLRPETSEIIIEKLIELTADLGVQSAIQHTENHIDIIAAFNNIAKSILKLPTQKSAALMEDMEYMMETLINTTLDLEQGLHPSGKNNKSLGNNIISKLHIVSADLLKALDKSCLLLKTKNSRSNKTNAITKTIIAKPGNIVQTPI